MKTVSRQEPRKPNVESLFEDIYSRYGYDLRAQKIARIWDNFEKMLANGPPHPPFARKLSEDIALMERALASFSLESRRLYSSAIFLKYFRERVIPYLKTFPSVKIWVAGCGSGEEAYALAVLLKENGPRFTIYATDLSEYQLNRAKAGFFGPRSLSAFAKAYRESGGLQPMFRFFETEGKSGQVREEYRQNIHFFQHNLGSDRSFNEFHFILCRNNLSFFEWELKGFALRVLDDSLCSFGLLELGHQDSLTGTDLANRYRDLEPKLKIYKKVPGGS